MHTIKSVKGFFCFHLTAPALRCFSWVSIFLLLLLAPCLSRADTVTLAWDASSDATGYKLFYGTASRTYTTTIDVKNVLRYTIQNIPDNATYYFAATAYDAAGNESGYSVEVSYATKDTIPPPAPGNFRRIIQQVINWIRGRFSTSIRIEEG
jgi:hypothetical protein